MISHELKTIFIHIPRTAGTSIETALVGNNWWKIEPATKHLDWQQAKDHYADYWDEYLKFTVIRNPWDWLASLFHSHGRGRDKSWEEYIREPNLYPHEQSTLLQSEIIGDEMDQILRYETLHEDFIRLCHTLGIRRDLPRVQIGDGTHHHYSELYSAELQQVVAKLFHKDIKRFGYQFTSSEIAAAQDHKQTVFSLKEQIAMLEHELALAQQRPKWKFRDLFGRRKR